MKEVPCGEAEEGAEHSALAEARMAGSLQHANVVMVHDVLERAGAFLIVSEFVPGGSLSGLIHRHGPLPPREALQLVDGILAGIAEVHRRGIVHCDLKPENILCTEDGSPKIGDFGVARVRRGITIGFSAPDVFAGTPAYMAPEQRRGEVATPAADIYAVGLILRACTERPLPRAVEGIVQRALSPDPADRWQTAAEMREAIREASRGMRVS